MKEKIKEIKGVKGCEVVDVEELWDRFKYLIFLIRVIEGEKMKWYEMLGWTLVFVTFGLLILRVLGVV